MFLGEYQHTLDPKGRVILPSAFREQLSEGLVMTIGIDNCLTVHPVADWERVVTELRTLVATDGRHRAYARVVTASAHPDTLDKQGRVTIPARLRSYAGLTKDVSVVGADLKVEIWDTPTWVPYRDRAMSDYAATDTPLGAGPL